MKDKSVLLGFCPIGKTVFSDKKAIENKDQIEAVLNEASIKYVGIDGIVPDGLVRSQDEAEEIIDFFNSKKISALFIPHCNFGTEGAAALIAKGCNVPVLLYGPADEAPLEDGSRLTDTLCGLLATSRVLKTLEVGFSYIENCPVRSPELINGIKKFVTASGVVKVLKGMRIGQIGGRIDFFWCTIINEADILRKFNIQVQPIDLAYFIRDVKTRAEKNRETYLAELKKYQDELIDIQDLSPDGFINGLAARDEMIYLAEKLDLDGFAVQGFPSLCEALGEGGELGMSLIQEELPLGAETDIFGVVSSVMLKAAAGNYGPPFLPEWVMRHPSNENAVLLWHGNCPPSLKKPGSPKMTLHQSWIMPTHQKTNISYPLKEGVMTVCRFEADDEGEYILGIGKGKTVDGPMTKEFYTWLEVSDWRSYERRLIEGPYLHHCSCIYDDCADVLIEACKFVPFLNSDYFG